MAMINISFDTKTKECDLQMDGVSMPDVTYVCIDKYDGSNYLRIEFKTKTTDGMEIYTTARANEEPSEEVIKKDEKEWLSEGLKALFS
jgi:hypothetical protein